jgi:glycerophosphoryl diester phosphodiesterase
VAAAIGVLLAVELVTPADAVPPVEPAPDPGRTVVLPRLVARATLPADQLAPGPPSGAAATAANGRTGPFDGQVIPGFSAAVANGNGTFWAMPDNGFGTKANSSDFLLRLYLIRPRWERAAGGRDEVDILRSLTLADPYRHLPFPIVQDRTDDRRLTGADLDIESLQQSPDGTFWIGDEFGPFLIHLDVRGRVLEAPVPFPLGGSPHHPDLGGDLPATRASGGFEATAMSPNGRFLYPILEKSLDDEQDGRRRVISQFDTRRGRYTARSWDYRVDTDSNLVADAQLVGPRTLLVLERDDFDGDAAVSKRVYRVHLDRTDRSGMLAKTLVVDLLKLDNPARLGDGDGWGTGDPFSFGLQSVETLVPLPNGNLLIASDNNYPGNAARRPGTPDDPELIIVDPDATVTAAEAEGTVIAHRGASGYRPEHTLASYALAIRQCADVIEPDIVLTKDNVPVARHENEIGGTTDVAAHPEFANRRVRKIIDGESIRGWFTEDFTLAELRTLRARERIPDTRPANTAFNGMYPIPTLAEVLDLARHSRTCSGRRVGVTPETKHPSYFASIGRPMEAPLLDALTAADLNRRRAPVVIQSFEVGNLQRLNELTPVGLSQLVNCSGAPYDFEAAGDPRTYATMATATGLAEIAEYADAVGFCKNVMIPRTSAGYLRQPSSAIPDAHAVGLTVIGWTFRRENSFLPADFRVGTDPAAPGDLQAEIRTFLAAGMDGYFTDNPDIASELEIDVT